MDLIKWRFLHDATLKAFASRPKGEIPLENVRITESLNKPGEMSATLPAFDFDGELIHRNRYNNDEGLEPIKSSLYVMRDGTAYWGGILWSVSGSSSGTTQVRYRDHSAFFERSLLAATKAFSSDWPINIAKTLIEDHQLVDHADLDMDVEIRSKDNVGTIATGATITREYLARDNYWIYPTMSQLAQEGDGFEWHMEINDGADPLAFEKILVLRQPEALTTFAVAPRLEHGDGTVNNIVAYSWTYDGGQLAGHIKAVGLTIDTVSQTAETDDFDGLDPLGWPRQTQIFRNEQWRTASEADNAAGYLIRTWSRPTLDLQVSYLVQRANPTAGDPEDEKAIPIDNYTLGDRIDVLIRTNYMAIDRDFKLVSKTLDLSNPQHPVITLTLRIAEGVGF